ncbi:hypothetical protein DFH07DRAFT_770221 [Mycena maculata]|uniref:Uncharacterized protein n=1 Tax=Mycena maculata TaxID=230809 RepID=A0AAD7JIH5_9AGAR|nr:hypothetical protein DFH07DRAFT_770221 [Mycena maculata]
MATEHSRRDETYKLRRSRAVQATLAILLTVLASLIVSSSWNPLLCCHTWSREFQLNQKLEMMERIVDSVPNLDALGAVGIAGHFAELFRAYGVQSVGETITILRAQGDEHLDKGVERYCRKVHAVLKAEAAEPPRKGLLSFLVPDPPKKMGSVTTIIKQVTCRKHRVDRPFCMISTSTSTSFETATSSAWAPSMPNSDLWTLKSAKYVSDVITPESGRNSLRSGPQSQAISAPSGSGILQPQRAAVRRRRRPLSPSLASTPRRSSVAPSASQGESSTLSQSTPSRSRSPPVRSSGRVGVTTPQPRSQTRHPSRAELEWEYAEDTFVKVKVHAQFRIRFAARRLKMLF